MRLPKHLFHSRSQANPGYRIESHIVQQPIDHSQPDGLSLPQHIDILIPNNAKTDSPVLLILGGEGNATLRRLLNIYKAYGQHPDLIMIQAEHRGYGKSLSPDPDQTVPSYVTVNQALADFNAVIQTFQAIYTGPWMAAGYSYSGGLVIDLAARYPDRLVAVLSSSGVIDWPFTMDAYDAKVRLILGQDAYQRLSRHIHNLQPQQMFDRKWLEREFLIAFIHGISQFYAYKAYQPIFKAAARLPTSTLLILLHALDRTIAHQTAWNYAISNSKLNLSRAEALSMKYTWRTWRYQQANEAGIYEISIQPNGIFNREQDDFVAEARALFGQDQPRAVHAPAWSPRASLEKLTLPIVYVAGGYDPWEALGLERDYPLCNGRYFFVPEGLHCPDLYDHTLGREVLSTLLEFARIRHKHPNC